MLPARRKLASPARQMRRERNYQPISVSSATLTPADLPTVIAFAGLPAPTLAGLLAHGKARAHADGGVIMKPGAPADFMMALVRGGVQFYQLKGVQRNPVFRVEDRQVSRVLRGYGPHGLGRGRRQYGHQIRAPALRRVNATLNEE